MYKNMMPFGKDCDIFKLKCNNFGGIYIWRYQLFLIEMIICRTQ